MCLVIELGIPGDAVDVLQADISDMTSLEAMCSSTKVIINCVGPVSDSTHIRTALIIVLSSLPA